MPMDNPVVCHDGTPKDRAIAITPDDNNDLSLVPCFLCVGTSGTLAVIPAAQGNNTPVNVGTVSGFLPIKVRRVMSTGTTAALITGWY